MHDLTGFQRDLLYVIAGFKTPKGLAIRDEVDGYYSSEIRNGRLYPNLDTLIDKGLIDKTKQDVRSNEYTLTNHGRSELQARRSWEDEIAGPQFEGLDR